MWEHLQLPRFVERVVVPEQVLSAVVLEGPRRRLVIVLQPHQLTLCIDTVDFKSTAKIGKRSCGVRARIYVTAWVYEYHGVAPVLAEHLGQTRDHDGCELISKAVNGVGQRVLLSTFVVYTCTVSVRASCLLTVQKTGEMAISIRLFSSERKKMNSDHHTYKQPTMPPPELVRVLNQPARGMRAMVGVAKGCGQERRWLILG